MNISPELIRSRCLVLHEEAVEVAVAEIDGAGRQHLLVPAAAHAWRLMKAAARTDGVELTIVFRIPLRGPADRDRAGETETGTVAAGHSQRERSARVQ